LAPVLEKLVPILMVTASQEQLGNGSPSTVQHVLDPSMAYAEGLAREVEAAVVVRSVKTCIQVLKFSRTEECVGA